MSEAHCPERRLAHSYMPDVDETSQRLIDDSMHADADILDADVDRLEGEIRTHYTSSGMWDNRRELAEFNLSKAVRTAAWAALGHVVYIDLMKRTLPRLREDVTLVTPGILESSDCYTQGNAVSRPYDIEAYDTYMRTGASWLLGASESVFTEAQNNPLSRSGLLVRTFQDSSARYSSAWKKYAEYLEGLDPPQVPDPPSEPSRTSREAWYDGTVGNVQDALMMLSTREAACPRNQTAEQLSRLALQDIEVLGRPARVGRKTFRRIFSRPWGADPNQPGSDIFPEWLSDDLPVADGYRGLLEESNADHETEWTDKALQIAATRNHRYCPGSLLLSPIEDDLPVVEEYYSIAEVRAGRIILSRSLPKLHFTTTSTLLVFMTDVAEDTIWKR